eukprot:scaffold2576_cov418-Prasinococcus_capsulatus_cf.AAC.6
MSEGVHLRKARHVVEDLEKLLADAKAKLRKEEDLHHQRVDVKARGDFSEEDKRFSWYRVAGRVVIIGIAVLLPPLGVCIFLWARMFKNGFAYELLNSLDFVTANSPNNAWVRLQRCNGRPTNEDEDEDEGAEDTAL